MKDHNISSSFIIYQNSGELSEIENELLQKAIEARANAYAPYSEFNVGASVLMDDGSVFIGNNQENAAYPSGICAERVAIWTAMSQLPKGKIKKIVITASSNKTKVNRPVAPCGSCRQAIAEYEIKQDNDIEIFFTGETGEIVKAHSIKDLLPWLFDNTMLK
jgi:cytidine deaminase